MMIYAYDGLAVAANPEQLRFALKQGPLYGMFKQLWADAVIEAAEMRGIPDGVVYSEWLDAVAPGTEEEIRKSIIEDVVSRPEDFGITMFEAPDEVLAGPDYSKMLYVYNGVAVADGNEQLVTQLACGDLTPVLYSELAKMLGPEYIYGGRPVEAIVFNSVLSDVAATIIDNRGGYGVEVVSLDMSIVVGARLPRFGRRKAREKRSYRWTIPKVEL